MTAFPRSRRELAGLAFVILVGLAFRLVPWPDTFTSEGVRFRGDTDPYYHALRAQRILAHWPRVPWTDPQMNFPYGAQIPWPPLFDVTIAAAAKAGGGTGASPERVAEVAALLALALGVALLPLVAVLGRRLLGGGLWLDAALLVAVLPASIRFGAVGAADQHGAELLLSCGIFFAFVASWKGVAEAPPRRWAGPVALGILMAAAFWTWLGSALYLLLLVGATGLWHVAAPARDRTARLMARALGIGGALAALLLAVSIGALAPAGALGRGRLDGLTGLHVAMCAVTAVFGGLLAAADRASASASRGRRFGEALAAGMLALVPFLAFAPWRQGVVQGLTALAHGNPWYASILEYRPLVFSGSLPLPDDFRTAGRAFGFGLLAMPFALLPMWRRWKGSVPERPSIVFLFLWGASFLVLTLTGTRFQLYLVVPLAFWVCLLLRSLGGAAARRWPEAGAKLKVAIPIAGILIVASPALQPAWTGRSADQIPGFETELVPTLRWLRGFASADASRPSVMAEWAVGHMIQYFAGKPVVVTPFGTEEGPRAPGARAGLEDWAEFLFTSDSGVAARVLARRRIGFVVLRSPKNEVVHSFGFAPPGARPVAEVSFDWLTGPTPRVLGGFSDLIANRLYYFDGQDPNGRGPSLGDFRLLAESPGTEWIPGFPPAHVYKVFGVVPGALIDLRGAPPGAVVSAKARIQTNQNRVFEWRTQTASDAGGRARLRLPYATGSNGLVRAGPYNVTDGVHHGTLDLDERDVAGARTEIDFLK